MKDSRKNPAAGRMSETSQGKQTGTGKQSAEYINTYLRKQTTGKKK